MDSDISTNCSKKIQEHLIFRNGTVWGRRKTTQSVVFGYSLFLIGKVILIGSGKLRGKKEFTPNDVQDGKFNRRDLEDLYYHRHWVLDLRDSRVLEEYIKSDQDGEIIEVWKGISVFYSFLMIITQMLRKKN